MRKNKIIKGPLYKYLDNEDCFLELNNQYKDVPLDTRTKTKNLFCYCLKKKENKYTVYYYYIPYYGYVVRYNNDYKLFPKYRLGDIIYNHLDNKKYMIVSTPTLNSIAWSLSYFLVDIETMSSISTHFYSGFCDSLHQNHMSLCTRIEYKYILTDGFDNFYIYTNIDTMLNKLSELDNRYVSIIKYNKDTNEEYEFIFKDNKFILNEYKKDYIVINNKDMEVQL